MTVTTNIGTLIERDTRVRGGRPILAGTGVTVQRIATWYRMGFSPEEIRDRIDHLDLAQVHAALAYYHANREEVDAAIEADDEEAQTLERELRSSGQA